MCASSSTTISTTIYTTTRLLLPSSPLPPLPDDYYRCYYCRRLSDRYRLPDYYLAAGATLVRTIASMPNIKKSRKGRLGIPRAAALTNIPPINFSKLAASTTSATIGIYSDDGQLLYKRARTGDSSGDEELLFIEDDRGDNSDNSDDSDTSGASNVPFGVNLKDLYTRLLALNANKDNNVDESDRSDRNNELYNLDL